MMKVIAPVFVLAISAIAPSSALAEPYQHRANYYDLTSAGSGSAGTAGPSSFPWTSIGVALAIVAVLALLLTTLHLTRRTQRTAAFAAHTDRGEGGEN